MSTNFESSSNTPTTVQQRRQANILLLRLQWLIVLLLVLALTWLYISQQRFQNKVHERLQSNEQVISRLNEMNDRLFAMSQQTLPEPSSISSNQAQNQLDLLRIQMQAADRLLADNNNSAAIELLRGLHWQLSQSGNEIASALTIVIKQSLTKDIENLQAQSAQPSPWQLQNLAIQNIQDFLHNYERTIGLNVISGNERNANSAMSLTRRQLVIYDVIMTLSLASQASNMREQDQLINHLRQARKQLSTLVPTVTSTSNNPQSDLTTMSTPNNISEVIDRLDRLIGNAPTSTPLVTTQILDKPAR